MPDTWEVKYGGSLSSRARTTMATLVEHGASIVASYLPTRRPCRYGCIRSRRGNLCRLRTLILQSERCRRSVSNS